MIDSSHPFEQLTPAFIMDAVESLGLTCDCRTLALNSYENRVYQVGLEEATPIIAKFYRPGRWKREQIVEEQQFCFELESYELPVVAPWRDPDGNSLFEAGPFLFALYPRRGGHAPEFDNLDNLLILGRTLGRMHAVAASHPFSHRPTLNGQSYGHDSVAWLLEHFIPAECRTAYETLANDLLQAIDACFEQVGPLRLIRAHGDCHAGNILWRDGAPNFVDFDDARMAPAVQDLWMMLSGDRARQTAQLSELIEGYSEFYDFKTSELRLIEALRTLRMMHYCAWLARRWQDPAFPHHFAWFNTPRYWDEHILQLREQFSALQEPALQLN